MGELEGKVAVVTGGARGLGAAIGDVFVREGATVVVTDVLVPEGQQSRSPGRRKSLHPADVTEEVQWQNMVDQVRESFGRIDVLVNNAGLVGVMAFEEIPPDRWERLIAVMQTGPYLGMRTVLPHMLAAGHGAIVNVASINALRGRAVSSAYTAAKHGLLGMTRALALEYARSACALTPSARRNANTDARVGVRGRGRRVGKAVPSAAWLIRTKWPRLSASWPHPVPLASARKWS